MINVALVRGKYLNNFEGQNYVFDRNKIRLTGIASFTPIHSSFPFPIRKLPSLSDLGDLGPEIVKKGLKFVANRILGDSQILWGLESVASQFDIFHTADPHYYYSYQLAKLRAQTKIKYLISTSWETIPFNNETIDKKQRIKHFVLAQVDRFICYTQKAKHALMEEGVNENKIAVVRLGVNLSRFQYQISKIPTSSRLRGTSKNLTILFVGRLVPEKGILDLYETFKEINKAQLKLVGDGPLKRALTQKVKNDGLEHKVWIETKSYEQMPQVYQDADVLVLPSKRTKTWEEQYGMVLVEAMASGLPIIAYDTGAIREIVGDSALLVRENDQKGLSASISRLIESQTLRLKLGTMGRMRAEKLFDRRKTAHEIAEIYQSLIKK